MVVFPAVPGRQGSMSKKMNILFLLILVFGACSKGASDDPSAHPELNLNLDAFYYETALTPSDGTLLASTLDGTLVALNQNTGEVLWELNDEPVVRSPYDASKPVLPAFLPDPKDGSIYMIGGGLKDPLKKLPFTIPELVAASPCKSTDGILYTGKKVDTWFSVDRYTGARQGSISFNGCVEGLDDQCPNLKPANFLIGRTEYNIMMFDSRAEGRKWNISFYDYSSNLAGIDVGPDYELAHFTDSSTGSLVTLDRKTGVIEWERLIGSPIVAMYRLEGDGIVNVPFTSVSKETLRNLMEQFNAPESNNEIIGETKLFPTLYVGEHDHGLYAMPSLVDEQTLTISPTSNGPLLLEGPQNFEVPSEINIEVITGSHGLKTDPLGIPIGTDDIPKDKSSVLLFGYYQVPEHSTIKLSPAVTQLQLTSSSQSGLPSKTATATMKGGYVPPIFPSSGPEIGTDADSSSSNKVLPQNQRQNDKNSGRNYGVTPRNVSKMPPGRGTGAATIESRGYDRSRVSFGMEQLLAFNRTFVFSSELSEFLSEVVTMARWNLSRVENMELKIISVTLLLILLLLLFNNISGRNTINTSHGSYKMSQSSVGSSSSRTLHETTAQPLELEDGRIEVGKITFNPSDILGKGCEGTFVYKGAFDNRDVAVKRVLAACFSIADREVDLLRESDEHPNVVRYFCMEQDRQFRYIALEYCSATLQDYVEGKYVNDKLDSLTILRQATQGLQHLHSLDIVHRDIKPHNVLISMPGKKGDVRAMISDFGLCKKLKTGRMSFSRRSGPTGTEGWIAPEMMTISKSNTCAVDIFSMGCVFYYVLTRGYHPFGESFRRQANILQGEHNLNKLGDTYSGVTARKLIEKMIDPEFSRRPSTQAVLKHPLFWSREKMLNFLQDVSDRVDKEGNDSAILLSLERNKFEVVRGNWQDRLDPRVRDDLRKHRSYNPKTVRDLLRALRNKRHHYNELAHDIKATYGRLPDQFADYWTSRFPMLLTHAWYSMHAIKTEPNFVKYFDKEYDFVQTSLSHQLKFLKPHSLSSTEIGADLPPSARPKLAASDEQVRPNLFEPQFRNPNLDEDDQAVSKHSVISNWDKLEVEVEQQNFSREDEDEQDTHFSDSDNIVKRPYLLSDSPFANVAAGAQQVPSAIPKPVQLASDAKQTYQKRLAEKKASLTFSETLQNVSADEKLKLEVEEEASKLASIQEENDENRDMNAPVAAAEEEEEKPDNDEPGAGDDEESLLLNEQVLLNDQATWKLPPEQPKSNKAKKNNKKKKGGNKVSKI